MAIFTILFVFVRVATFTNFSYCSFPNFVKFISFANRIYYSFSYLRVVNGGTFGVSGFRYFAGLVNMTLYNS